MKKLLTAIGDEELNTRLRVYNNFIIVNQDVQYQEGIIEALDEYQDIDIIILHEDIMGELELDDLIRSIIILKNDIEIILVTENTEVVEGNNIIKIIYDKENYVKEIEEYLLPKSLLKEEDELYEVKNIVNATQNDNLGEILLESKVKIEKLKKKRDILQNIQKQIKSYFLRFSKTKEKAEAIIVLGKAGVRKNYIYKHIIKNYKIKKSFDN